MKDPIAGIRRWEKDIPPASHAIVDIALNGQSADITIAPRAGYVGCARTFTIAVSDDDTVFLSLGRAGFFTALYLKSTS
jgi:hypothetical protein